MNPAGKWLAGIKRRRAGEFRQAKRPADTVAKAVGHEPVRYFDQEYGGDRLWSYLVK